MRPDADYHQSLALLKRAAERRDREQRGMITKSGIMVGLGETFDEVVELMQDLHAVSCDHAKVLRLWTLPVLHPWQFQWK